MENPLKPIGELTNETGVEVARGSTQVRPPWVLCFLEEIATVTLGCFLLQFLRVNGGQISLLPFSFPLLLAEVALVCSAVLFLGLIISVHMWVELFVLGRVTLDTFDRWLWFLLVLCSHFSFLCLNIAENRLTNNGLGSGSG